MWIDGDDLDAGNNLSMYYRTVNYFCVPVEGGSMDMHGTHFRKYFYMNSDIFH
jgi:hypothetical protein